MKSENAIEYLHSTSDEKEFLEMTDLLPLHDAIKAVEIAEAERDAKAVEVFRKSCPYNSEDWCCKYSCEYETKCEDNDDCYHQGNFIKKLNEE